MNNIQNYGMTNYSLGFKANNSRALETVKNQINYRKNQIQHYNDRLINAKYENVQKCTNILIDTYKNALHRLIIKAKLLKRGYNPDEILPMSRRIELQKSGFSEKEISCITEREQLKTLAASGDKAAARELAKREA